MSAAERAQGYRRLFVALMRWLHTADYAVLTRWPLSLANEAIAQMQAETEAAESDGPTEWFDGT